MLSSNRAFRFASLKHQKQATQRVANLSPPASSTSNSLGLACSAKWCAVPTAASSISVVPLVSTIDAQKSNTTAAPIVLSAHSSAISALQFSRLADDLLASASSDGSLAVWRLPESKPRATLTQGFEGGITQLAWHPAAADLLLVVHKRGITLVHTPQQNLINDPITVVKQFTATNNEVVSACWNYEGSALTCVTRDARIAHFDPRTASADVLSAGSLISITGLAKVQHILSAGKTNDNETLLLLGLTSGHRPMLQTLNHSQLAQAQSNATPSSSPIKPNGELLLEFTQGAINPVFDSDTELLFVSVRGSNVLSIIDIDTTPTSHNNASKHNLSLLHSCSCDDAFKGLALINKRACDVLACEIARAILLTPESNTLESYSCTVPRKVQQTFYADLFPPTADCCAALSADAWLTQQHGVSVPPILCDMQQFAAAVSQELQDHFAASSATTAAATATTAKPVSKSATSSNNTLQVGSGNASTHKRALTSQEQQQQQQTASNSLRSNSVASAASTSSYQPSSTRAAIESALKTSTYRHIAIKEPASVHETYYALKVGQPMPLGESLHCNDSLFAVPQQSLGGSAVCVVPLSALGRQDANRQCVLRGHKSAATAFDLSQLDQQLVATGSADGDVRLYKLDQKTLDAAQAPGAQSPEPFAVLQCKGRIVSLHFHPLVSDVLLVVTSGFDGNALEFWNIKTTQQPLAILDKCHPADQTQSIIDVAFHPRGHLVATTCKDGQVRVITVPQGKVQCEFTCAENIRDTRVLWATEDQLLTLGFGAQSIRSISLHQLSDEFTKSECRSTVQLDRANNALLGRYDYDTRVLYAYVIGSSMCHLYEVASTTTTTTSTSDNKDSQSSSALSHLNSIQLSADCVSCAHRSKQSVRVDAVELQRALRLTADGSVQPLQATLLRKRALEFFQNDVYPQTRDVTRASMSAQEFASGKYASKGVQPHMIDLNTAKRPLLSDAPPEAQTERQARYAQHKIASAAPKEGSTMTGIETSEQVAEHFQALAAVKTGANR